MVEVTSKLPGSWKIDSQITNLHNIQMAKGYCDGFICSNSDVFKAFRAMLICYGNFATGMTIVRGDVIRGPNSDSF